MDNDLGELTGLRREYIALAVIIIVLFWIRMTIAASQEGLSYDSYLTVRQVEHIQQTGLPLRHDTLSVTGETRITNPVFNYVLALFVGVTPLFYKLLPNLFMALLLIPVFLLTKRITKSSAAAFLSVVLAGSGPLVFSSYINTPSSTPVALFLFLCIIAMLHNTQEHLMAIIACAIALTFIHPLIFILVFAILAAIVLLKAEGFGIDSRLGELFFFTLLLALWFYVILYKNAFFTQGIRAIWQNLPTAYAQLSFAKVTFLAALYGLGIVTFLFGTIGVYHALFEIKERSSYAVVGTIISIIITLIIRGVSLKIGFLLLGCLLAIMAANGIMISVDYIRKTKFPWSLYPLGAIILVFFIFTSVIPALSNAKMEADRSLNTPEIESLKALRFELPEDAVLLTTVKEGAAVQYFSGVRTLTDNDFLMVSNSDELVDDIDAVYTARFKSSLIGRSEKLGFTSILFTPTTAKTYNRDMIAIDDDACIPYKQIGTVTLYSVLCGGDR